MHPYRWHILISIACLMVVTFVVFGIASKRIDKVTVTANTASTITTPSVSIADPQLGAQDAAVVIVEYADFTCESCKTASTALAQLVNAYPDDVRLVWKDFPNESKSDEATPSAIAARCADAQNAFWPFHDELFLRQSQLAPATYTAIAEALDLNTTAFASCIATNEPLPRVRKAYEEGLALNITATPTLFINSERYTGSIRFDELESMVKSILATRK